MNIIKKIGFFLVVLLFVVAAGYGYFYLRSIKKPALDAFSQLPDSCIIYVRTNNFFELNRRINSRSLIADKMRGFKAVDDLCRVLKRADSLFAGNEQLLEQLQDAELHFALYGQKKIFWLATFNIKELGRQEKILSTMETHLSAVKKDLVYQTDAITGQPVFYTVNSGVITLSDSEQLLQKSADPQSAKFADNPSFINNKSTFSESNLISLYVNHALYSTSGANNSIKLGLLTGNGFSASSIETDPSSFTINGYYDTEAGGIFKLFAHQQPQPVEPLLHKLPSETVSFKAWGLNDLATILTSMDAGEENRSYWKIKNELALFNVEKEFYENAANYFVRFASGGHDFIALQVKDTVKADEVLAALADSSFSLARGLSRITVRDSSSISLFSIFDQMPTNYSARCGDFLYFSESAVPLQTLMAFLGENATLKTRTSFMSYQSEHIADNFNLLLYNSPSSDPEQIRSVIKFKPLKKQNPYEDLKHLSFSLTNDDERLRFRLHLLNESGGEDNNDGSLWTFVADTLLKKGVTMFINHNSKERELICTDAANSLYLLNAKGNKLWKKKLPEEILSGIHMVDAFKNNKYQMLFNTSTHLYLVDRNGNDVEGYPVKLPSQATSGLSLYDYENNKDYRIILPCGNSIYNFDISGSLHTGFKPVKTVHPVKLPVQYTRIGANDYLVALDSEGAIIIFNRRGEIKINLKNRAIAGCRSFFADAGGNTANSYVVYFDDKSAILNKISFADKKLIAKLDPEFQASYSAFTPIDENRLTDILITSGSAVSAYNLAGQQLLYRNYPAAIDRAAFYSDENRSFLFALASEQKNLFMNDQATQKTTILQATELPLLVNLFRDNKKYMLVENGRRLTCLPLN